MICGIFRLGMAGPKPTLLKMEPAKMASVANAAIGSASLRVRTLFEWRCAVRRLAVRSPATTMLFTDMRERPFVTALSDVAAIMAHVICPPDHPNVGGNWGDFGTARLSRPKHPAGTGNA